MGDIYDGPTDSHFLARYGEDADFIPPVEGGKQTFLGLFFELEEDCPAPRDRTQDPRRRARFVLQGLHLAGATPESGQQAITFDQIEAG